MSEWTHVLTIAVPESLIAQANQLALAIGTSEDDVDTFRLARATDVFLEAEIETSPQVFRRKIAGGQSILDAVRENGNVVELAKTLATTLVRESQQRQRLAARLAGRSATPDTSTEFGSPHLDEDA